MKFLFNILIIITLLTNNISYAQQKLHIGNQAPSFTTLDVYDKVINMEHLRGKKVILSFYRSVGCPVCNLYFHTLQEQAKTFKEKNVVLISVYESPKEAMLQYTTQGDYYSIMIPDPSENLYRAYAVQRSWWKMFKANFKGIYGKKGKIKKGYSLYKKRLKYDAHLNRMNADFLIDENGKIMIAYYSKYFGDHLPINRVLELL